jgi:hypothetical protein
MDKWRKISMLTARETLDTYFLDTRCMLLEIAATLDRLDLAEQENDDSAADHRLQRIYDSLKLLAQSDTSPDRAERLLNLFTDVE